MVFKATSIEDSPITLYNPNRVTIYSMDPHALDIPFWCNQAMKSHNKPHNSGQSLPIVSLFSGSGGLDLGFEDQGFQPLVAYDASNAAVRTYNHNRKTGVAKLADLAAIGADRIVADLACADPVVSPIGVIGGPPCQAFSRSNVYPEENDLRRTLPGRFANILKKLNDQFAVKFFVFENVQGLTFKRHEEEFARFRHLFEQAGFFLHEALLNAKDFGLPQDRPRVIIVGINRNLSNCRDFQFPQATHSKAKTVGEAFERVFGSSPWPQPAFFRKSLSSEQIPYHPNHWTMVPRSEKFRNGYLREGQMKGRSFRVLAWNRPSWTVAYGNREIHIHPSGKRRLSIFEAMILQGFPPEYELVGNFSEQVKLVSDAVPPPLAAAIAGQVRKLLARHEV